MAQLTLVLGGMRSGKSRFAEELAARHPPVVYLATALAGDAEMTARIAAHRQRRECFSPPWQTVEEPWEIGQALRNHSRSGCVLLDCLTLWLTNLVVGTEKRLALADDEVRARLNRFAEAARETNARVIVVSNEVGCGLVPANALARRFGDLLGEANQRLAAVASEVYACVAGIPLRLK
jgi:adenosyl cobinamide kinase/adenosyl cobinamide phosphate guanylyltransferase